MSVDDVAHILLFLINVICIMFKGWILIRYIKQLNLPLRNIFKIHTNSSLYWYSTKVILSRDISTHIVQWRLMSIVCLSCYVNSVQLCVETFIRVWVSNIRTEWTQNYNIPIPEQAFQICVQYVLNKLKIGQIRDFFQIKLRAKFYCHLI